MNLKYYFLLLFTFFFFHIGYSNNKKIIKLIHADIIQKKEQGNNNLLFLIGNVHLIYNNGYHLFCDKVIYDKINNQFYGYGNVLFTINQNKIFSQKIEYNPNIESIQFSEKVTLFNNNLKLKAHIINFNLKKQLFQAIKNVVIFFKKMKLSLYTSILEYDFKLKKFFFKKKNLIQYKNLTIYSQEGSFFPKKKKVILKYKIKLINNNYIVYTNHIEYLLSLEKINFYSPTVIINNQQLNNFFYFKIGSFFLKKNIFISTKNCSIHYDGIVLKGESFFFNNKKKLFILKKIFLEYLPNGYLIGDYGILDLHNGLINLKKNIMIKNKKNSFFIHSDNLQIYFKNYDPFLIKIFPIKSFFFQKNVQIKSDFLIYNKYNNSISFFGNPIFWINNQQLTGEKINININKNFNFNSLKIIKKAFYIQKINSKEFNQIQGDSMLACFDKKNIFFKIFFIGNVQSIIFPYYKQKKLINKSFCEKISIDIKENFQINNVFLEKVKSELFIQKTNIIDNNIFFLPNFLWKEKNKHENQKYILYQKIKKFKIENLLEQKEIKNLISNSSKY
ncbi:OstA-like protein [Blattabacterium cuenoti]|uniref:OstA-like protein n=1 Tax=Blattabacterium cuenoti TaxID=1653831 RepID=UPI00163C6E63|nr:OstA-like protein [Blattabacterium cuenoti]